MSTAAAVAPAPEQPSVQASAIPPQSAMPPQPVITSSVIPVAEPETSNDAATILGQVIAALENTPGGDNLASTLAEGTPVIQGNELSVTVARPASVLPFMISPEQKQVANAAASTAAGRPLKLALVSGTPSHTNGTAAPVVARPRNGTSARSRAADDPIVQRMREKFGAEIRTVIDHREKN
jgi:DNA polymerase-3 subunit gamma/tau